MTSSMRLLCVNLLGYFALSVLAQGLQPGCNTTSLPQNFSANLSHWPHSTPLLRNHWRKDPPPPFSVAPRDIEESWNGWASIKYLFALLAFEIPKSRLWRRLLTQCHSGDSYTSTNFTLAGPQPSFLNPLGNPPYPGGTSANGPNYIDFLTTTYNKSFIQTFNLAYGGATVNPFLVPTPFGFPVQTFLSQVKREFLMSYESGLQHPWSSPNSLFVVFFGINDVINSYMFNNESLNLAVIKSYEGLVDEVCYSFRHRKDPHQQR